MLKVAGNEYKNGNRKGCRGQTMLTNRPTTKTRSMNQYVRRTGKMTKKEKKELASKNTKVTDWMSKKAT
jgi:hypothetical protein